MLLWRRDATFSNNFDFNFFFFFFFFFWQGTSHIQSPSYPANPVSPSRGAVGGSHQNHPQSSHPQPSSTSHPKAGRRQSAEPITPLAPFSSNSYVPPPIVASHLKGISDFKFMAVLGRGHFGKVSAMILDFIFSRYLELTGILYIYRLLAPKRFCSTNNSIVWIQFHWTWQTNSPLPLKILKFNYLNLICLKFHFNELLVKPWEWIIW